MPIGRAIYTVSPAMLCLHWPFTDTEVTNDSLARVDVEAAEEMERCFADWPSMHSLS